MRGCPESVNDYSPLRSALGIPSSWHNLHIPISIDDLPPLPPISEPALQTRAVTHRNVFTHASDLDPFSMHRQINELSYEPLEFIGDKYIATRAALVLRRQFQDMPPSRNTELVSMLLSNHTLSYIAVGYKLHQKLAVSENIPRENEFYNQKVCADLLEAHIGALLIEAEEADSEEHLKAWLAALFSPSVFPTLTRVIDEWRAHFLETLVKPRGQKRKAASEIPSSCNRCSDAQPPPVLVEYRQVHSGQWHVTVGIDGREVGCGSGMTKSDAHKAAFANAIHAKSRTE